MAACFLIKTTTTITSRSNVLSATQEYWSAFTEKEIICYKYLIIVMELINVFLVEDYRNILRYFHELQFSLRILVFYLRIFFEGKLREVL
jgi:hypothetical protein